MRLDKKPFPVDSLVERRLDQKSLAVDRHRGFPVASAAHGKSSTFGALIGGRKALHLDLSTIRRERIRSRKLRPEGCLLHVAVACLVSCAEHQRS